MTRGLKNNNPGNIRLSAKAWRGEIRPSQDRSFCQFETIVFGYRALLKLLRNYRLYYGSKTVSDMINRWAPPVENSTDAYIKTVCQRTGLSSSHIVDIDNKAEMCKIAAAISYVECSGIKKFIADIDDIYQAWEIM